MTNKDDGLNPIIAEISALKERVARLEEKTSSLESVMNYLKTRIEKLDGKIWAILTGVILSILIQIALSVL